MSASPRAPGGRCQALAASLAGKPIFWSCAVAVIFAWPIVRSIHAAHDLPSAPPVIGVVHAFALGDQNGGELDAAELQGRVWIASFTRVECEPSCAESRRLMAAMAQVRHRTRNLGDAIRLVTLPVNPEVGTVQRMSQLSAAQKAGHGGWRFLSGPPARVRQVLADFQVSDDVPQTCVALVDTGMQIRGFYDAGDPAALARLLRDVGLLLSLSAPPA